MEGSNWESESDFRRDEPKIIENILWLEANPIASTANNTKDITAYVIDWLSNCPYVTVLYDEMFLENLAHNKKYKFSEKFRVTYLFGKSYYILLNPDDSNEVKASARGIEGMVKVYRELKKIDPDVKHRLLEKYSRMEKKGKIEAYTESMLNKPL
jgi:hypothetical protein